MESVQTISLPARLVEEAKAATGKHSPRAAIRALLQMKHVPESLRESELDFTRGRYKGFTDARKAMKWLKS